MKPWLTEATGLSLEAQVVGAILAGGSEALLDLPPAFTTAAITHPELRRALEAAQRLISRKATNGGPIDRDLLIAEAGFTDAQRKVLEAAEFESSTARRSVRQYADALLDKHRRSSLLNALAETSKALQEAEAPTADVVARLSAILLDLDQTDRPETLSYREALLSAIDAVDRSKSGAVKVLRTGFASIDAILKVRPGNLIVLAARPKVGKTTLARQIARAVALRGLHVAWHGLEMDAGETIALDLSAGASIDSMAFFDDQAGFNEREWAAIQATGDRMLPEGKGDGFIHANHYHHSVGAICRVSEKLHRKHGLALIVVDYLQLVQCDLGRNATRENVVSTISRTLKLLAMRLGVPVLALSQLNRESAKRGDPRQPRAKRADPDGKPAPEPRAPPPQLHDLRESGAIEQDANAVCFLHNPFSESQATWQRTHGPFDFIVAAQRLGPTGSASLHAEREFSRFKEING